MQSFFHGRSVLVTGSSNGIGRETARMFAKRGARVVITGRNAASLRETRDLCIEYGAKEADILEIVADLEKDDTPKRLIDETVNAFGSIDVLINNAGFALTDGKGYTEMPVELFDRTMNVNLRSILVLTQLATPFLEKAKGSVVNVSSIAAFPVGNKESYYCISKAALDQLTVQQAAFLIHKDIRVNSVNPGITETDIVKKMGVSEEASAAFFAAGSDRRVIPLGRTGQPADIAKLILFLSDRTQSEFIVGQRIVIDGGTTIKGPLFDVQN